MDNNHLPNSLAEAGLGAPKDPYGNPYQYLKIAGVRGHAGQRKDGRDVPINSDFDLYSMGKDGQSRASLRPPVSHDDIIRARDGAFVGLASTF